VLYGYWTSVTIFSEVSDWIFYSAVGYWFKFASLPRQGLRMDSIADTAIGWELNQTIYLWSTEVKIRGNDSR